MAGLCEPWGCQRVFGVLPCELVTLLGGADVSLRANTAPVEAGTTLPGSRVQIGW